MGPHLAMQAQPGVSLRSVRDRDSGVAPPAFTFRTGEGGDDDAVAPPLVAEKRAAVDRLTREARRFGFRPRALDRPAVADAGHADGAAPIERPGERPLHADSSEPRVSRVKAAE